MTGPADYTGYALYREAMDAFGDPVFARWICRGYPWGGVDLNRAREGFLLARDGVSMTGGDARTVLNLLVREVTALEHRIDHEGQAAVLGPAARALRRLMTDIRRLANATPPMPGSGCGAPARPATASSPGRTRTPCRRPTRRPCSRCAARPGRSPAPGTRRPPLTATRR